MTSQQKQKAVFTGLLFITSLLGWRPLLTTLSLSWRNDEYTYILLIVPFSIALFFLERPAKHLASGWGIPVGLPLLLSAVGLAVAVGILPSRLVWDMRLSCEMLAIVLSYVGSFVLCFGLESTRRAVFPLVCLFGLIPLPDVVMNQTVAILQEGSAWSAHVLLSVFGVPVVQNGVILKIPDLTIQVAQECSSIRSSSLLLITALISAKVLLRSPWHRFLVIALAIPLSVAKNGLRIFTIAILGTRVDPAYLTGRLHRQGGILFFLVALVGIFLAITIVRRRENLPAF